VAFEGLDVFWVEVCGEMLERCGFQGRWDIIVEVLWLLIVILVFMGEVEVALL